MSPPRVLVPDRSISVGSVVHPDKSIVHHLTDVLRLSRGDPVVLVDGDGHAFTARLDREGGVTVLLVEGDDERDRAVGQSARLVLVMALLKSDLTELAVQKCTEAGVTEVLVAVCDRSVPRPDEDRLEARRSRLNRVAASAARQCSRASVPRISVHPSLDDAVLALDPGMPRFLLHEGRGTTPLALGLDGCDGRVGAVLAVGPEGSFTDREIDLLEARGFVRSGLGPRVLRAETAAIAGIIIAQSVIGDMAPD